VIEQALASKQHSYARVVRVPFLDLVVEGRPLGKVGEEFTALVVSHDVQHSPLVQRALVLARQMGQSDVHRALDLCTTHTHTR